MPPVLSRPYEWDNKLFGVSDAEAVKVDPQQRYVLECTYMALEDGGITKSQISDTQTGVYIGTDQSFPTIDCNLCNAQWTHFYFIEVYT